MRKTILIIAVALTSVACSKYVIDPLRINIDNTYWSYSTDEQTARVCFPDGEHASVLQLDYASHTCQALHGTYSLDGHRVLLTGNNWPNEIKFVRTFSHLKNNSTNKNLTPVATAPHTSIAGSVWTTMSDNNLNVVYFGHDGTCVDATFINAIHKEGLDYGWDWHTDNYVHEGKNIKVGNLSATLFDDMMQVEDKCVLITAPAVESDGSSALTGTIWTYDTKSYPGLIIFTSDSTFTRVLVGSGVVYVYLNGTYQLSGTSLTMKDGGDINETCQLSADRFTFLERSYVKVTLP